MALVFRTVLALLLAVAVPMQGLAAAAMLHCGPNHHRQGVPTAAADDHSSHGHSGHHVDAVGPVDSGSQQSLPDVPNGFDDASQAKCSACANCCSSAAIPTTAPSLAEPQPVAVGFILPPQGFAPVDLPGLKRPPRPFLA